MKHFNQLQGYDTNITLEFFHNLQGETSMVQYIRIPINPKIVVEVTSLPNSDIQWTGRYTMLKEVVEFFVDPSEELDKK
jgi:hypothetical protein